MVGSEVPLRVIERGSGSTVVMVHGAWGGPEDWLTTIVPLVEEQARCIVIERPGHGWSSDTTPGAGTPLAQARGLRAAVRELGIERPILAGFSYGASVCAAWATQWPDEVAGVLLVSPALYPWTGFESAAFAATNLPLVGELSVPTVVMPMGLITAPASLAKVFTPETPPESFAASPWRLALRTANFRANIRDLRRLRSSVAIVSPYYPRITAPVRLVHGTGDRVAYADFHSARFAKEVQHAQVTFIPDAGHQVLYTHPRIVAEELEALLQVR